MNDASGVRGLNRVGVKEEWELHNWSREFGVTPQELKKAIDTVGVRVIEIRRFLSEPRKK